MVSKKSLGLLGSVFVALSLVFVAPATGEGVPGEASQSLEALQSSLGRYVKNGVVDYAAWSKDLQGLDQFVDSLERADLKSLSRNQKKALLINAYNAFMLRMILSHYPIKSVFDIKPNPFKQERFKLGGKRVSLDRIEHEMLRKMGDARIHFAIVCGSKGCPDLANEVYRAEPLDAQLDAAARRYFSQDKGLVVTGTPPERIRVSKILEWFGTDFGEGDSDRIRFVARFAPEKWRAYLKEHAHALSLGYLDYDWSLNGP